MNVFELGKAKYPRRFYGECQRCQRTDYLPWATEHGERYCGWCHEKDSLDYASLRGWTRPEHSVRLTRYDMRRPSSPSFEDAMEVRICRTLWGRLQGACWLLFTNWGHRVQ